MNKALILAGGSGTRLWPVSRIEYPKQFLKIGSHQSLLQKTVMRILRCFSPLNVFVLTSLPYLYTIKEQLLELHPDLEKNVLIEPDPKNTAPAIAFALRYFLEVAGCSEKDIVFVSPSDQVIEPQEKFSLFADRSLLLCAQDRIVAFGIKPTHPETGYGYIEAADPCEFGARIVKRFVEKPDAKTAQQYIDMGNFYWNSGMFAFQIKTMVEEFQKFCPEISGYMSVNLDFEKLPSQSIDYAVMEKSKKMVVFPLDLTWSDIGSWDSVFQLLPKDHQGNSISEGVINIDSKNSLILGSKRLIAAIGLEEMLVVETADAILIAKKDQSQKVKEIVSQLQTQERKEIKEHVTIDRPWGSFTVLEEGERYKIKKIIVNPGQMLSLQMHFHRSEHWVVVKGTAKVIVQEKESLLSENDSIYVPKEAIHRICNPGKETLEIIEIQVGEYLGEDDIVRLEDVYGRNT
ncbi:MAG TPA: mannose-1-phosphate guanylyltransferase/mannose-6-phosphate isomerase [Chlamydiales bacterium]|nr:mannose-1-phosphate guanylyltransferase/mannose-6-phosphate isomerase [Chlamydiales bacterium]